MAFEEILRHYKTKTCVLSVEKTEDGRAGAIRVVNGNQAHCDDILHITGHPFQPGCPYEFCFPKNKNFEDFCYRAAIEGEPMHSYVSLYEMGLWLNMFLVPLESEEENTGYCIYSYDVMPQANSEKMSDISADSAARVLGTCIKLHGASDFKKTMDDVIADIRDICGADECCVLYMDDEAKKCICLGEARKPGAPYSINDFLNEGFYYAIRKWEDMLQGSTCIIIKDDNDMEEIRKRDPAMYEGLQQGEIESLVLFPLKHGEHILGYIWALNFDTENYIKIKETLELTTFFVASEVANHVLVEQLRTLSSVDLLTGTMNRNIMNNRVDRVIAGKDILEEPYAIVFTDMNGLKRLNDTEGHNAGDDSLKQAAAILTDVFYDGEVYRVGGDEFMVIACKIEPEEVEARVASLIAKANATENVRFAVGISHSKDEPDILKGMRTADKRMYEDKKRYYEEHPDRIYRQ